MYRTTLTESEERRIELIYGPGPAPSPNMYVCFEMYYKHGEWESHVIASDEEMRTYCIDQLEGYGDQDPDTDDYEELHRRYIELPLEDLIALTIEKGRNQIEHQWGWGLQSVTKCKNAVEYTV